MPPFVGTAVKVAVVPAQILGVPVLILTLGVTVPVTVIVTTFDVPVNGLAQAKLEVITQETLSLFENVLTNVVELVPAFTPFTFHWYGGVPPPLLGDAVNVAVTPEQIEVDEAAILRLGATVPVTVIVTTFDVAVKVVAHVALLVITQLTVCPLLNVLTNVVAFVPAFTPFTFH